MGSILEKTIAYIRENSELADREIRDVHLNEYFTVVELDDGSVGAAASDYRISLDTIQKRQRQLHSMLGRDPLLLECTRPGERADNVLCTVRVAAANALSARLLRRQDDPVFECRLELPQRFVDEAQCAVVVGFGGFLPYLARKMRAGRIHVSDLSYHVRRAEMEGQLARYRRQRPDLEFSISDGSDSADRLSKADFASITGSTLCNDTLEGLLDWARSCRVVILQGQSAAVHPKALFEAGINLLATTIKPRELATAAFWDASGLSLRRFLEGGLPWVYFWPRK